MNMCLSFDDGHH